MGIKRLFYLLILLLFVCCKPEESTKSIISDPVLPTVNSIGDSDKIEIVTWNIERFPKTDYSDDYVKAIIEGFNADIFLLQEIQSKNKFASMLDEMDDYNYYLQGNDE